MLDDFASAGDAAEGDTEASLITSALRQAARRDEHEMALAVPLRKAAEDAITLLRQRARKREPVPPVVTPPVTVPNTVTPVAGLGSGPSSVPTPPSPPPPVGERVRAKDVPAFVERICEAADEHPGAEFEIAWRIVER